MKLSEEQVTKIKKLLAKMEADNTQDALDEMVHDVMSKKASDINNGGEDRQIEFLAEQVDTFAALVHWMGLKD